MKIYPIPFIAVEKDEKFVFCNKVNLLVNESFESSKTVDLFCELWSNFTFGHSELSIEYSKAISEHSMQIGNEKAVLAEGFEYSVNVSENGIGVAASCGRGLIHAFCTLLQLITPISFNSGKESFYISGCIIDDKPALEFRCYHASVFDNLDNIKKTVRLCGLMKYSYITLEFFGSIKLDCMPELAFDNAFSKDEIKPLIEEANAFGIEVIPIFNHLGHAACAKNELGEHVVLSQAPEKGLLFEPDGWTFCVSNPETLELLKKVRLEMMELCGKGSYFHVGGDEAYSFATCDECKKRQDFKLLAEFFNGIASEMRQYGRRIIVWGDSLLEYDRWATQTDSLGHHYEASTGTGRELYKAIDCLDKDIIISDWQYKIWDSDVLTSEYFKDKGFDVIPASAIEVKNIDALCTAAKKLQLPGLMQTYWDSDLKPIIIIRGGVSSWSDNIESIDRTGPGGEHQFIREYMLMNHFGGKLIRQMFGK